MSPLSPSAVAAIEQMERLISRGWTQGTSARNQDGKAVSPVDPGATCFCLSGALVRAVDYLPEWEVIDEEIETALNSLVNCPGGFVTWNDQQGRTQVEVLALLQRVKEVVP